MNRRRLVQSLILVIGLAGIAVAISRTVEEANEQVLPSAGALAVGAVLAQLAIVSSARAWVALFSDLTPSRSGRAALRGTFYLSQLTKYLPVGGVVQAASQLGLAPSAGVPLRRAVVAYPVSAVAAAAAGATLGSGLALDSEQPAWIRALALSGLATTVFLHRGLMARGLELCRRFVHRIPNADHLPTQRDILAFYGWALVTIGALCAAYAVLLRSLDGDANPLVVFCAFAISWVLGFLAVPIPAGIGIREAVLVGLLPEVGTAPVLAASLALRLLTISTELLALLGCRVAMRRTGTAAVAPPVTDELVPP
jgi:hypothetical protein